MISLELYLYLWQLPLCQPPLIFWKFSPTPLHTDFIIWCYQVLDQAATMTTIIWVLIVNFWWGHNPQFLTWKSARFGSFLSFNNTKISVGWKQLLWWSGCQWSTLVQSETPVLNMKILQVQFLYQCCLPIFLKCPTMQNLQNGTANAPIGLWLQQWLAKFQFTKKLSVSDSGYWCDKLMGFIPWLWKWYRCWFSQFVSTPSNAYFGRWHCHYINQPSEALMIDQGLTLIWSDKFGCLFQLVLQ